MATKRRKKYSECSKLKTATLKYQVFCVVLILLIPSINSAQTIVKTSNASISEEQAAKRNGSRRMIDKTSTGKVCCLTLLIEIKGIRNISTTSAFRFSPQVFKWDYFKPILRFTSWDFRVCFFSRPNFQIGKNYWPWGTFHKKHFL